MSPREPPTPPEARTDDPGMLRSGMRLVPHDPSWAEWFAAEAARLRAALGSLALRIEHVGSTAVPDLLAKPVIDICVVVATPAAFTSAVDPLARLGYRHRGQHGDDPLRSYFVLDREERRVAQLHMYAEEAPAWQVQVRFRDLLCAHADLRRAYEREKLRVAEAVGWDKSAYAVRKGPFIEALLEAEGPG